MPNYSKRFSFLSLLALPFCLLTTFFIINIACADSNQKELILGGTVSGLSDKLVLDLDDGQEELKLSGDGPFTFKTTFAGSNQSYSVKIKKPAPNHICKLQNASGVVDPNSQRSIVITCQKTGSWDYPDSLADNISPDGQNGMTPVVALDGQGNGVVVWSQYDGKFWRIFKSEYRDKKWLNPASLKDAVSPGTSDAINPKVAMAGNGDMVIVWEQKITKKINYLLVAEKRKDKWRLPDSPAQHISVGDKFAWNADVAMDDLGNTIIVWDQAAETRNYAVYKSEYRKGSWQHPTALSDKISPDGGDALRPRVAMNNRGAALITWEQDPGRMSKIFKSEYRKNAWTHPVGNKDYISPKSERGGAYRPIPAMSDNGQAFIVWEQSLKPERRIYKSEYRNGQWHHPKSLTDTVSPLTETISKVHDIAVDSSGNAIIVFSQTPIFYDQSGKRNQTVLVSELRNGAWKNPSAEDSFIKSAKDRNFKVLARAAMSDSGKAVIVWQQMADDRVSRVFLAEYDHNSWFMSGKQVSIDNNQAMNVALAASKNGSFMAVWQQSDGKFAQIYKSEFHLLKK